MKRWVPWFAGGSALLLIAVIIVAALVTLTDCDGDGPPETGIDAGPGLQAIDERERRQAADRAAKLREIERDRSRALEHVHGEQRREYEAVRRRGSDAVLDWLRDFDRHRFGDGSAGRPDAGS